MLLSGIIILGPLQLKLFFFRSVGFRHLFSILGSSLISLHTLQALWLNYVLRSMSKHGRRVICREFPFIHYYSEGWAQLSASNGCAQHGSLYTQQGPTKPLSLALPLHLSPAPPTHTRMHTHTYVFSLCAVSPLSSPPPRWTPDRFTQLTHLTLGSPFHNISLRAVKHTYTSMTQICARTRPIGVSK